LTKRTHLQTEPTAIRRIEVEKLFGEFSYMLPSWAPSPALDHLFIIYGDNGTGKTTILRLVYALLSSSQSQGNKTRLANVPFRRLSAEFNDGTRVEALRSGKSLLGTFTLRITRNTTVVCDEVIDTDADNRVQPTDGVRRAVKVQQDLKLSYYLLSDDRSLRVTLWPPENNIETDRMAELELARRRGVPIDAMRPQVAAELRGAIDRLEKWLRRRMFSATRASDDSFNSLYLQVIRRLARQPANTPQPRTDEVLKQIGELRERSESFAPYGFTSRLSLSPIQDEIVSAPQDRARIIAEIAKLYIESVTTRLDKFQELRDLIASVELTFNSYFSRKTVSLHLLNGFSIHSANGQSLQPEHLSSGERHLLLLICNVIVARDAPSVFMVDEPELSLNIKWQRRLLSTLLNFSKGGATQFILATHSLELLSQFEENVVKLDPASEEGNAERGISQDSA
jgi:ABC-type molybdenum transport system ATPase subunit/photorepair protein PhrA